MSDSFDPYYKWLSIPPAEQPANHYRLLGVPLLVNDSDVIEMAADRQMMAVRTFQSGQYSAWSQHILNEISQAKFVLLSPEHKAAYDAQLRQQFAPQAPAAPTAHTAQPQAPTQPTHAAGMTHPEPNVPLETVHTGVSSSTQRRRKRKRSGPPVAMILTLLTSLAVIAIVVVKLSQNANPRKQPTQQVVVQSNKRPSSRDSSKTKRRTTGGTKSQTESGSTGKILDEIISGRDLEIEPSEDPPTLLPATKPIDLLAQIDLQRHAIQGNWRMEQGHLVSEGKILDRIQIPFEPPEDYDLTLEVTHQGGPSQALILGLVGKGHSFHLVLNESAGSGIGVLDGKDYSQNESLHPGRVFSTGKTSTIHCKMRRTSVSLFIDDEPIIEWKGNFERVAVSKVWTVPNPRALWIGANAVYRISKIEIKPYGESPGSQSTPENPDQPKNPFELAKKRPIPNDSELRDALKLVKELYQDDYAAARQVQKKFALAKKLYDTGRNSRDDPVGGYVLLHEAARLAAEVGDTKAAIEAIYQLSLVYEIDDIGMRLEALNEAGKQVVSIRFSQEAVKQATQAAADALDQDRFAEAVKLGQLAVSAARRTKDTALTKRMAKSLDRMEAASSAYQAAEKARETLSSDPDNAEANLVVGRYLCFVKNDWPQGLPRLLKGGDAELKSLVQRDLAEPTDPKEQAALGDQWWDRAALEKDSFAEVFKTRAKHWYHLALPRLSALTKLRIEKQLREDAME